MRLPSVERTSLIFRLLVVLLESAVKVSLAQAQHGMDSSEEQTLRKLADALGEERLLAWIDHGSGLAHRSALQLILAIEAFLDTICRDR